MSIEAHSALFRVIYVDVRNRGYGPLPTLRRIGLFSFSSLSPMSALLPLRPHRLHIILLKRTVGVEWKINNIIFIACIQGLRERRLLQSSHLQHWSSRDQRVWNGQLVSHRICLRRWNMAIFIFFFSVFLFWLFHFFPFYFMSFICTSSISWRVPCKIKIELLLKKKFLESSGWEARRKLSCSWLFISSHDSASVVMTLHQ